MSTGTPPAPRVPAPAGQPGPHDAVAGAAVGTAARATAHLRSLWSRDTPAFGLWSSLTDPAVAELLAQQAFDYTCVDLQHGMATYTDLPFLLQAMRAGGAAPLVRVPWNEPAALMRVLDSGACGVVVPMVDDAAAAARAAAACRYPPVGARSWGPMWGAVRPDGAPAPHEQDEAVLCFVMVETRAGLDDLERIVAVDGVDGVYIGPNDLALSCGHGRATYRDAPEVDAMLQRVVDACRAAGVVAGLHCSDVDMARHWAGRGARLLTVAQDSLLLAGAAAEIRTRLMPR